MLSALHKSTPFIVRGTLAFLLIGLFSAAAIADTPYAAVHRALRRLHIRPGAEAENRNRQYIENSTSPAITAGLEMLLQSQLAQSQILSRRLARRVKIDGGDRDWRRLGGEILSDAANDLQPIDPAAPPAALVSDDLQDMAFAIDERAVVFRIRPARMPSKNDTFYYAFNFLTLDNKLIYNLALTHSGFWLQEFNPANGEWVRSKQGPRGTRWAAKRLIEGRAPLRLFPNLTPFFRVEAVSWSEERNVYDGIYLPTLQSRGRETSYNYSLELFARYAERTALAAEDPLPLAQAIVDGYLYRRADEETRELIIEDGLVSFTEEADAVARFPFPGQADVRTLPFPEILTWANRALYYGVNSSEWKLLKTFAATGGVINRDVYQHLFLTPAALQAARALIAEQNLLIAGDLPATLRHIETWLQTIWKYRAPLPFIEKLYQFNPAWYEQLYQEVRYENEHRLTQITTVGLDAIEKHWNQSAAFQIAYIRANGFFYGNCGDSTVIAAALGKALGVPTIHLHYDVVADNGYEQAVHSFPAYYNSGLNRYIGYASGNNRVFEFALSGTGTDRVFFYQEVPIVSTLWGISHQTYPGTYIPAVKNTCGRTVTLEQWEEVNLNGSAANEIEECMRQQLMPAR